MAAILSSYTAYIFISFLPPIIWLLFYLREDSSPEPKRLLFLVFIGGIASAIFAIVAELLFFGSCHDLNPASSPDQPGCFEGIVALINHGITIDQFPFFVFLGIAFLEEYFKYAAVRILVLGRREFDEPIDAMIYMMTAALGFAAIENFLFILPSPEKIIDSGFQFSSFQLTANRFIGANLLHVTSSGIVGFFLARAFFSHYRHHFLAIGIILASLLHGLFNYLIIKEGLFPGNINLLIVLLTTMSLVVLIEFEQLKKKQATNKL